MSIHWNIHIWCKMLWAWTFFAFVVFVFIYIRLLALTHSFVRNQFYSCDHCHERLSLSLQSKHVWFFFFACSFVTQYSQLEWLSQMQFFLLVPLDDLFAYDRNLEQGEKQHITQNIEFFTHRVLLHPHN